MKEDELRKNTQCSICGNKIGANFNCDFFIINIERYTIDFRAVQKQDHLAGFLNSSVLANVMGTNEDMAKKCGSARLVVCFDCYMENPISDKANLV